MHYCGAFMFVTNKLVKYILKIGFETFIYLVFDSYIIEDFALSSMQKATLTVVNVPVPKSPLN